MSRDANADAARYEDALNTFIDLVGQLGEAGVIDFMSDALHVRADACEDDTHAKRLIILADKLIAIRDEVADIDAANEAVRHAASEAAFTVDGGK